MPVACISVFYPLRLEPPVRVEITSPVHIREVELRCHFCLYVSQSVTLQVGTHSYRPEGHSYIIPHVATCSSK